MKTNKCDVREGLRKPEGGFCLIRGTALMKVWEAYRQNEIGLLDLRVWFACWEAVARRCGLMKGRVATYRIEEIRTLVNAKPLNVIRRAITRLERAGLMHWSESAITMTVPKENEWTDELVTTLELVTNHRRPVPVPRRIVRLIAGRGRKVMIATILGFLLRCLYYKGGLCLPEGTCKSSWIADVFGVNTRNVKAARKQLISMGWIVPIDTRQTCLNRFGGRVRVNLLWSCNDINRDGQRSPLKLQTDTGLPPPKKDKKLSRRSKQPETRTLGPAGVEKQKIFKAHLRNVRPDDLRSSLRMRDLFREAATAGVVSACEADQIKFFAAAERAQSVGKTNPCGLFVTLIRERLWSYISQAEEDRAWSKLKRLRETGELSAFDTIVCKWAAPHGAKSAKASILAQHRENDDVDRAEIRAIIKHSLGLEDIPPAPAPCAKAA